jgi:hypothetical protein
MCITEKSLKEYMTVAPVAHTCKPSYSGGRDQEDHGSKPAVANGLQDPVSKKLITKTGWWCVCRYYLKKKNVKWRPLGEKNG